MTRLVWDLLNFIGQRIGLTFWWSDKPLNLIVWGRGHIYVPAASPEDCYMVDVVSFSFSTLLLYLELYILCSLRHFCSCKLTDPKRKSNGRARRHWSTANSCQSFTFKHDCAVSPRPWHRVFPLGRLTCVLSALPISLWSNDPRNRLHHYPPALSGRLHWGWCFSFKCSFFFVVAFTKIW